MQMLYTTEGEEYQHMSNDGKPSDTHLTNVDFNFFG